MQIRLCLLLATFFYMLHGLCVWTVQLVYLTCIGYEVYMVPVV